MACAQLHERDRRGARSCVRRRHRAAVHRVHLLRRREHVRPDADADGHRRQHRQARPARALCQAFSARRRVHDGGRPAHPARRDRAGRRQLYPAAAGAGVGARLRRIHVPARRRADRNAVGLSGRGRRAVCARAADAAAPDAVWLHRPVRCGSMSGLCRAVPAGIAALAHRPTASGGVYLRDAVHHSGLPVHHERHRHVQAGHALRTRS